MDSVTVSMGLLRLIETYELDNGTGPTLEELASEISRPSSAGI